MARTAAAEDNSSPDGSQNPPKRSARIVASEMKDSILSPGFRSAAAMAGWDEEAIMVASLVVEDTPVRESRSKRRPGQQLKSPPSTKSTRKRRSRRRSPDPIPPVVLNLDDADDENDPSAKKDPSKKGQVIEIAADDEEKKNKPEEAPAGKGLPCMDRLREELSCAICLEICFEPSTTPCGHSFCKNCLRRAADKCGKRCPKCRQLISIGRSCTVNTVLWNTIQLLFPEEVEERKKAAPTNPRGGETRPGDKTRISGSSSGSRSSGSRSSITRSATQVSQAVDRHRGGNRRAVPGQSEDAALALRMQREEFMEAFQDNHPRRIDSLRENLRAMAARAAYARSRGRTA